MIEACRLPGAALLTWDGVDPQLDVMHQREDDEQSPKHHVHPVEYLHTSMALKSDLS